MKIIELHKSVTESNDRDARQLRSEMKGAGRLMVNIMSSPGAGKTTLLSRIIQDMKARFAIGVMEADIASDVDALRIEALGAKAIQAHTDGMCHVDAGMSRRALEALGGEDLDLIFLENVGNLICPAQFDTGAGLNVMILSVPEGDDKPLKYPIMFRESHALVISKVDTLPYFNFSVEECTKRAKALNPAIEVFPVSARTGEGMEALEAYLAAQVESWRK